jgi:hypothetical protein
MLTTDNKMKFAGVYSPGKKSSVNDTTSYDSPSPESPSPGIGKARFSGGIPKLNINLIN